jgi:hypothetical protein
MTKTQRPAELREAFVTDEEQRLLEIEDMRLVSGRIEARIGLRMMPTFPRSPLSFRTAGFPSVRLEGWLSKRCLPG